MSQTLLEQLGGRDAVELVVAGFYDRVLADERLRSFFRGVSMARLQRNQVDFFCAALGGDPTTYKGRDMSTAHAGLSITDDQFNAVAAHLADALRSVGVSVSHVDQVIALIAPLRAQVVTQ